MKRRLHIGWLLFAIVMVWSECIGDVPRLLLPHRTTPEHFFAAFANVTAVLGLTFYAFRCTAAAPFWRLFAPAYALFVAAEFGRWLPPFTRVVAAMFRRGGDNSLALVGAVTVTLPLLAMTVFSLIALFRLGDWIGPSRRPVGVRPAQLQLPI
jgi:hypothetical protein